MSPRAVGNIILVFLLWVCCPTGLRAEDIRTNDGRVFKNAIVVKLEAEGIVIKHDGGSKQIGWAQLPADLRKRYQAEAQKQKTAEIQKLKQDLARAEAEAAKLNQELEIQPKDETAQSPAHAEKTPPFKSSTQGNGAAPEPAKRPLRPSELKPEDTVDASELIELFKADSTAAGERWRQKTFRVKGVIHRFEGKLFLRQYAVILESPERFMRVILRFDYPDAYKSIYTIQNGQKLVGRPAENKQVTLMTAGDMVVVQGRCQGLRGEEIAFTGCRIVR